MSYQIKVMPDGPDFVAEPGETLLEAALRQGLEMSCGCRDGACGACKGTVVEGRIDHGKAQPHALTEAEKQAGKALFCCARPTSDLRVECRIENSKIAAKVLSARIEILERLAPDVIGLGLRLPAGEHFSFRAGQYIDILLKEGGRRSFSLANAPGEDFLRLHIRRVPGGRFTGHLFSEAKVRDILRIHGPHGSFHLREHASGPAILLAGGTGFAPIQSMVEHSIASGSRRPLHIYRGARVREDLYLPDLPAGWAAQHDFIHYVPVLSEPAPEDAWTGRTGWVHQAVLADFPDLSEFQVYACGSPAMIEAARGDFITQGHLPEAAFFADAFTFQ